ncbi:MAG TPA: plastocyanin/azurin family copper-binding protein [Nitrososphaerales archaeon]
MKLRIAGIVVAVAVITAIGIAWFVLAPHVIIQNYSFTPKELTIKMGTTVTWINIDLYVHTVRSGTPDKISDEFDSGDMGIMGIYRHTFTKPGVYEYHCQPHQYMLGKIIVEA